MSILATSALKRALQLAKPSELDRVLPGCWAAIVNGHVIAWARTLEELRGIMTRKGYKKDEYGVIKVPRHDLLVV